MFHISIWGGLVLCLGDVSPPKTPWRRDWVEYGLPLARDRSDGWLSIKNWIVHITLWMRLIRMMVERMKSLFLTSALAGKYDLREHKTVHFSIHPRGKRKILPNLLICQSFFNRSHRQTDCFRVPSKTTTSIYSYITFIYEIKNCSWS